MIIYKIKIPATKDPEAFAKFMRDEYFPAVHKGATRVGKILGMRLVQGGRDEYASSNEFYWLIEWSGLTQGEPRVDDEAIAEKFKKLGAKPKRLGLFTDVAAWAES